VERLRHLVSRSTGLVVSLLAGVTVLGLALSVFTLSATSTRASEDAAHLHLADEVLRSVDAIDAQARQLLLIGLIQAETEADVSESAQLSTEQLDLAINDARVGLAALVEVDATTTSVSELDGIAAAVDRILAELDPRDPTQQLEQLRTDVIAPLDALRERLDDDRTTLIARIERSNGTLRSFATLTGFVVAFVVPTVAVTVHRISTRLPREELRLRGALAVERREHRDLVDGLDEVLARDVASPLGSATTGREQRFIDPDVLRANLGVERALLLLRSATGALTVRSGDTDLGPLLDEIASPLGMIVDVRAAQRSVVSDPQLLTNLVRELARNADQHGGQGRIVVTEAANRRLRITVEDRGPGLPADVVDSVFNQTDGASRRQARRAARGTGLVLASRLARQLGVDLSYERADDRTLIHLDVLASERHPSLVGP